MLALIRLVNQALAMVIEILLNGEKLQGRDLDAFHAELDTTAEMLSQIGEEL